ncbi:sphingosine-1-phosphate phosphohydrolase [Pseudoneurospora amorphoporcata]|uniref:Sphingosine-1-phosphate phosphohydrolase n=1 Tax=Pseudoneurospora amorphoporcata TaxID=241081 RepID=A0AAN6NSW4_9PEZI|nr:sphingosine-1-phosphate phosphohydrolase [Pseudoneurospora amorphoporcata]
MGSHHHGSSSGAELSDNTAPPCTVKGKPVQNGVVDAGLKSLDHYQRTLPEWRYKLRQRLLPLIRWETPYLAMLQEKMRTPALDRYFAITANLGTHTFFMIGLPVLFWCSFSGFGKGLVHILAAGVFWTGFVKDMLSLPRPLSPPLHRITMSGSAALEYGFPSTHSANAVSVTVYSILVLHSDSNTYSPSTTFALELLAYFYAFSIVFGRLYCGMHGFLDVIMGSVMGAAISYIEFYYGPSFQIWLYASGYLAPILFAVTILILVRIHPEPADDCPCFDDSVSFAGVILGLELGTWHFARSRWDHIYNGPNALFDLSALGRPVIIIRLILGVLIIFAWRQVMKPTLLKVLPHLFRVIENHGLSLPRRFFMPATEYKDVPLNLRDDEVLPKVSDIPRMMRSIRGPGRGRAVSIGPQSAADAYETLAYRERKRRESLSSEKGSGLREVHTAVEAGADGEASSVVVDQAQSSGYEKYERQMGQGHVVVESTRSLSQNSSAAVEEPELYLGQRDELGEKEIFSKLTRPRVRYDVEVVTKLVVYAGIGWLAVDTIPILFELTGLLGAGHLPFPIPVPPVPSS